MATTVEEDFLEVDQPIPGQNYTCISFISPEKVVKQKETYFLTKFLQDLLSNKNKRDYVLSLDLDRITYDKVNDMIEDFRVLNETKVYDEFDELNEFKTSARGVKVRGVYDTLKEAKVRAKILQRKDPKFNVFVGQVGYWLPWDPSSNDEIEAEYQEKQLNDLMKNYRVNAEQRDMFYQEEKQKKIEEAVKENAKRKQENIEKGFIDPEKLPKDNVREKLGDLRGLLAEKDAMFNEMSQNGGNVGGGSEMAAITGTSEPKVEGSRKVKTIDSEEVEVGEKVVVDDANDPLGNKSGHADPWMARKMTGEKPLPEPTGKEVMTHNGSDTQVIPEQTADLTTVIKGIF